MREQYPFFRDPEERTRAVIGGEAADADLNGEYRKPYAILSDCRLYLKNERGNFIIERDKIKSAGKGVRPGLNWFAMCLCLCLILTAAVLCFWHFGMKGRYSLERVDRVTGKIIREYEEFEAGIPAREEQLKTYEDLGKELKRLEGELAGLDPQQVEKDVTWAHVRTQELQRARDKAQETRDSRARSVSDIKSYIAEYNRALAEAERKIENTDKAKNNELKSQIDALQKDLSMWNSWKNATDSELWQFRRTKTIREGRFYDETTIVYLFDGQEFASPQFVRIYCGNKAKEVQTQLSERRQQYVDIASLESQIEWNRQYIAESEQDLAKQQLLLAEGEEDLKTAIDDLNDIQPQVQEIEERKARVDELSASITAARAQHDAIPYEDIREAMQRHEADEANYRAARHLQWELKLVVPVFGALLLCALAALVLGILRRTKAAVFTGWITAGAWAVGIVALASLVNSVGAGYDEYGYGWYGGYESVPSPLAMLVLPIAALLLGVLALWWNRKKTVYQIVHNTGAFFFTPSVYPAEELELFTEQAQLMQAGETDGK